jgi:hypothetical protein
MMEIGTKTPLEARKRRLLGFRQQNLSSASCISMDDLSTNSSGSSSSSRSDNGGVRRSVAFDSIEILEFPIELGDNPAVRGTVLQLTVEKEESCAHVLLFWFVSLNGNDFCDLFSGP